MNVLIVEDEILNYQWLNSLLQQNFSVFKNIIHASSIQEAILAFKDHEPELIFLDIRLGKENGFELFQYFTDSQPHVIFTTAHEQYAIDAIKKGAHDYILKPVMLDELQKSIARLELNQQAESLEGIVVIKTKKETFYFKKEEILYVKAERAYSTIFTLDQKLLISKPLKKIHLQIPEFLKSHRSFIVNPLFVTKVITEGQNTFVILSSGDKIPLSLTYMKSFKDKFE